MRFKRNEAKNKMSNRKRPQSGFKEREIQKPIHERSDCEAKPVEFDEEEVTDVIPEEVDTDRYEGAMIEDRDDVRRFENQGGIVKISKDKLTKKGVKLLTEKGALTPSELKSVVSTKGTKARPPRSEKQQQAFEAMLERNKQKRATVAAEKTKVLQVPVLPKQRETQPRTVEVSETDVETGMKKKVKVHPRKKTTDYIKELQNVAERFEKMMSIAPAQQLSSGRPPDLSTQQLTSSVKNEKLVSNPKKVATPTEARRAVINPLGVVEQSIYDRMFATRR